MIHIKMCFTCSLTKVFKCETEFRKYQRLRFKKEEHEGKWIERENSLVAFMCKTERFSFLSSCQSFKPRSA